MIMYYHIFPGAKTKIKQGDRIDSEALTAQYLCLSLVNYPPPKPNKKKGKRINDVNEVYSPDTSSYIYSESAHQTSL